MPYFEYPLALPDSPLLPDTDGFIAVPDRPGLGFILNQKVVERFRVKLY